MHWLAIVGLAFVGLILFDLIVLGLWILFGPHPHNREKKALREGRLVLVATEANTFEEAAVVRARLLLRS